MKHPRYLAIVRGPGACPLLQHEPMRERLLQAGFSVVTDSSDLLLLADAPAQPLADGRGWIVGQIFAPLEGPLLPSSPGATPFEACARTLLDRCWGNYVAFLADPNAGVAVLRDPSGGLPCYHCDPGAETMFFSDLATLEAAGFPRPAIDWAQLLQFLKMPHLRPARTPLDGVTELLRGEMLHCGQALLSPRLLWTPAAFASRAAGHTDRARAVATVCEVVPRVIASEAAPYGHILLGLSGGLDSSVVAASLARAGANFTCLTIATREAGGDERSWARQVAHHVGAPLVEVILDESGIDIERSDAAHLPWPVSRFLRQAIDRLTAQVAADHGIEAHFDGGGGDSVFCYLTSVSPVVDRYRVEGLSPGVWRTIGDVADVTGAGAWTIARRTIQRLAHKQRPYGWIRQTGFLAPDLVDTPPLMNHPWIEASRALLPGKAAHIALLLQLDHELDGLGGSSSLPHHSPLMAQPVVEACLRVPSWMWCAGGINRSLAREAFATDLPASILARRSKGGPESFSARVFEANRTRLLPFLHEGRLASEGFLDLAAVDAYLRAPGPVRDQRYLRLLALANVEAWARARG